MKEYTTRDWLRELLPEAEMWQHELVNNEIEKLRAETERLRAVVKEVVAWDLNWANGLDENVERIQMMAEAALRGEGEK